MKTEPGVYTVRIKHETKDGSINVEYVEEYIHNTEDKVGIINDYTKKYISRGGKNIEFNFRFDRSLEL